MHAPCYTRGFTVINQMDTSQAHLSSKATAKDPSKPDNLSKDELTAVLKYGAQKMSVSLFIYFSPPYSCCPLYFYIRLCLRPSCSLS